MVSIISNCMLNSISLYRLKPHNMLNSCNYDCKTKNCFLGLDIVTNSLCVKSYGSNVVFISKKRHDFYGSLQPQSMLFDNVMISKCNNEEVRKLCFSRKCIKRHDFYGFLQPQSVFLDNVMTSKCNGEGIKRFCFLRKLNRSRIDGFKVVSVCKKRHKFYGFTRPQSMFFGSVSGEDNVMISKCNIEKEQKLCFLRDRKEEKNSGRNLDISKLNTSRSEENVLNIEGNGDKENRLCFLEEMNEEELSRRILKLSRSNKTRSVMELYRTMEYLGLRPNIHACNSLISCLLRNGMLDNALRIFEKLKTRETISGHTYSLVLKAIANGRSYEEAMGLFEELESEGKVKRDFDVVAYNTMISICGKVNDSVQALRIWRCMKDNEVAGTIVTYRLLVCIFVRCGLNELATDAYLELLKNGFDPGKDEMQAVIGACSKEGNWELALEVYENMSKKGMTPNLITCNALINALGKEGKAELAFDIYEVLKSSGHSPDNYTWKALLNALYRANRHGDVLYLFDRIRKQQSSELNLHLYNICLMSCQKLGSWDKSLKILYDMEASGLPLSASSYNLVIGACESARKPKIALQVYEHMIDRKCDPDSFTLLSLIRCCVWGSLWYEVEELLNVMPDAALYNAAIQGTCLRGKIDLGRKFYGEMQNSNLKPDGKTRAMMLQNLQKRSTRLRKRY